MVNVNHMMVNVNHISFYNVYYWDELLFDSKSMVRDY